jgi:hypothetical protein
MALDLVFAGAMPTYTTKVLPPRLLLFPSAYTCEPTSIQPMDVEEELRASKRVIITSFCSIFDSAYVCKFAYRKYTRTP